MTEGEGCAARGSCADTGTLRPDSLARLAQRRRWIPWLEEYRPDSVKPSKIPRRANGRDARPTDPRNWHTYGEAARHAAGFATNLKKGVGVVLGLERPDDAWGLGGFDLDECVDSTGRLLPWATAILDAVPTYGEQSPSGRGLHLLFRYDSRELPELRQLIGQKWKVVWYQGPQIGDEKRPAIELHLGGGYFTVSRIPLQGHDTPIGHLPLAALRTIIQRLNAERASTDSSSRSDPPPVEGPGVRPSNPKRPIIGQAGPSGFLRIVQGALTRFALTLRDTDLQVLVAAAGHAGRQEKRGCAAILPHAHLLELRGRNVGSTRDDKEVRAAKRRLNKAGILVRTRVAIRPPRHGGPGQSAHFDLPWLAKANPDHQSRRKLPIARDLMKAISGLRAVEVRLMLLMIDRHDVRLDDFSLSPEAIAADIGPVMRSNDLRPPKAQTLCKARDRLVASGWLEEVKAPTGSSPGLYRFGPRLAAIETTSS